MVTAFEIAASKMNCRSSHKSLCQEADAYTKISLLYFLLDFCGFVFVSTRMK